MKEYEPITPNEEEERRDPLALLDAIDRELTRYIEAEDDDLPLPIFAYTQALREAHPLAGLTPEQYRELEGAAQTLDIPVSRLAGGMIAIGMKHYRMERRGKED